MKIVQPIRDREIITNIKNDLMKTGYRNYLMFVIGINTGLRVSDILALRVSDVKDKTHITITEQKTDKTKRFFINDQLRQDINVYIKDMEPNEYLFKSRQRDKEGNYKHMSRVRAYQILNDVAGPYGLDEIGTHTMRKTFGYWHYKQHKDIALLQNLFNHSAPSITMRYIGIDQDIMDKSVENFYL